jgi:hypothetical protein
MTLRLSFLRSRRFWFGLLILGLVVLFFVLRSSGVRSIVEALTPPKLPKAEQYASRVMLNQNWDAATSERFHFISQGTSTLPVPYDWLLALEQPEKSVWGLLWPGANDAFTAPDYLGRYGFIAADPSPSNPDGLPIGFAQTPYQNLPGYPGVTTSVGFTCAACHTGHFTHDGTEYIVNGGPSTIDLQLFSGGLGAALGQTLITSKLPVPNKRFDRFARRVLGDSFSEITKSKLAKDMQSVLTAGVAAGDVIDVIEGFGRLDALNRIGNQVFSKNTARSENYAAINAPVNFPHIWTASWFDWVQYDGSIMQPLVRNAGEAMGVHANVDMTAPIGKGRFSSSVPVKNLTWIEETLSGGDSPYEKRAFGGLHGPRWPEKLGTIDTALANEGSELYEKHCRGCHLPPLDSPEIWNDTYFQKISYQTGNGLQQTRERFLTLKILALRTIGTDAAQSDILEFRTVNTTADPARNEDNMGLKTTVCTAVRKDNSTTATRSALKADPLVKSRPYQGQTELIQIPVSDGPMVSFALALGALVQQVNDAWFEANFIPDNLRPLYEGERPNCLQAGAGYKARPLNGVWATGPFLHNGSVPTLDDLLRPADQRPRFVQLGALAFDPDKVGVRQPNLDGTSYPAYARGRFILDTALPGNRNTGHAFGPTASGDKTGVIGPEFTDRQRAAIIEFLKTL